ncbi:MAG: hypothetical protein ACO331_15200 [Prochlorothrix sp.]
MSVPRADAISTIYAKSAATHKIHSSDLQALTTISGQFQQISEEEQNCIKRLMWMVHTGRVQVLGQHQAA